MTFYVGSTLITPTITKIGSSGTTVTCINQTNHIISENEKVWINENNDTSVCIDFNNATENSIMGYAITSAAINENVTVEILKPRKSKVTIQVTQSGNVKHVYIDNQEVYGDSIFANVGTHTYIVSTAEEGIVSGTFTITQQDLISGYNLSVDMTSASNYRLTVTPKLNGSAVQAYTTLSYTYSGISISYNTNEIYIPSNTTVSCYASTTIDYINYEASDTVLVTTNTNKDLNLEIARIDTTIIVDENATVTIEEAE